MLYHEQSNVFSAVVGILGVMALDAVISYEKNPNKFLAAGQFPDLIRRGATPHPAPPNASLESKASKRPWAVEQNDDTGKKIWLEMGHFYWREQLKRHGFFANPVHQRPKLRKARIGGKPSIPVGLVQNDVQKVGVGARRTDVRSKCVPE